jgi:TetR/AcrR family transcriptional regulator
MKRIEGINGTSLRVDEKTSLGSPGTGNRKATTRQKNEKRILMAAEKIFAQEGYAGATIEQIASEAKLPRANILYYFRSKKNLYQRVLYDVCLSWEGPANKLTIYSNPKEAMTNYINAKIDFARERPFGSKLWASEALRGSTVVEDYLRNHLDDWIESRSQVFNHWITLGLMKPIDTKVLFYSIWATTQHYADCSEQIKILNGGKPLSDKQYAKVKRDLVSLYLRGLGMI